MEDIVVTGCPVLISRDVEYSDVMHYEHYVQTDIDKGIEEFVYIEMLSEHNELEDCRDFLELKFEKYNFSFDQNEEEQYDVAGIRKERYTIRKVHSFVKSASDKEDSTIVYVFNVVPSYFNNPHKLDEENIGENKE